MLTHPVLEITARFDMFPVSVEHVLLVPVQTLLWHYSACVFIKAQCWQSFMKCLVSFYNKAQCWPNCNKCIVVSVGLIVLLCLLYKGTVLAFLY